MKNKKYVQVNQQVEAIELTNDNIEDVREYAWQKCLPFPRIFNDPSAGYKGVAINGNSGYFLLEVGEMLVKHPIRGFLRMTKADFEMMFKEVEKSDYKDRVIAEKAELDEKIEKLSDFIVSEKFEEIVKDFGERYDMRNQLLTMRDYSRALKSRIERF